MKRYVVVLSMTVLFLFGMIASAWSQSHSINVGNSGGRQYLTDSNGMTLYYFTKDVAGKSACNGGCAKLWPVFHAASISAPPSLDPADFGTITRTDGTQQTTYKGWPLYYFAADKAPGDMKGEGVRKIWYVMTVPFYTIMVGTSSQVGNYLTDANGKTLYYFTKDSANTSACNGGCAKLWPAFYAPKIVVPAGLNAADFGSIARSDGTMQSTYKGYPLYYWVRDSKRGDTSGQGVGKVWFVVDPGKFNPGM